MAQRNPRRIAFDLRELVGRAAALALLTAVIRDSDIRGVIHRDSSFERPKRTKMRRYLLRMDSLKVLFADDDLYARRVKEGFRRGKAVGFRPCSEFTKPDEAREVAVELSGARLKAAKRRRWRSSRWTSRVRSTAPSRGLDHRRFDGVEAVSPSFADELSRSFHERQLLRDGFASSTSGLRVRSHAKS
jgi:hypothetical protein